MNIICKYVTTAEWLSTEISKTFFTLFICFKVICVIMHDHTQNYIKEKLEKC